MAVLGIDFGGSQLRVAEDRGGSVVLLDPRPLGPPLVLPGDGGDSYRAVSLKRLLDFDSAMPAVRGGQNSLDYLAAILREVRQGWEARAVDGARNCVMAAPPCFSQRQRAALRRSLAGAGFARSKLIDDTAAALWASRDRLLGGPRVLVYSWGATTFSAALYQLAGAGFELLAQEGSRTLGGDDIDTPLLNLLLSEVAERAGLDVTALASEVCERAMGEVAQARATLAQGRDVVVPVDRVLGRKRGVGSRLGRVTLPRKAYTDAVQRLTSESLELAGRALTQAACARPDAVLVVGGTAQLSAVQAALRERFGLPLVAAEEGAVAKGAVLLGLMMPPAEWEGLDQATGEYGEELKRHQAKTPEPKVASAPADPPAAAVAARERWADLFIPTIDQAQQHYDEDRLDQAIAVLGELTKHLSEFSGYLCRGEVTRLAARGRPGDALQVLRSANRHSPQSRLVALDLAEACDRRASEFIGRKRPQEALAAAREGTKALQGLPELIGTDAPLLARLNFRQGQALSLLRQYAEAVPYLQRSVQLDGSVPRYRELLTQVRASVPRRPVAAGRKYAPNGPCPCGRPRKYKHCCGRPR